MKCRDPCPGSCGTNAICQVVNHLPMCSCMTGYSGDPFRYCSFVQLERKPQWFFLLWNKILEICNLSNRIVFEIMFSCNVFFIVVHVEPDPCNPSPCGPNSLCRSNNGKASCSCLPPNKEGPNGCRPECVVSSECPANRACVNNKCIDPCSGVCGIKARCETINHSPICSCSPNDSGDPFVRCFNVPSKLFWSAPLYFPCTLHQTHYICIYTLISEEKLLILRLVNYT